MENNGGAQLAPGTSWELRKVLNSNRKLFILSVHTDVIPTCEYICRSDYSHFIPKLTELKVKDLAFALEVLNILHKDMCNLWQYKLSLDKEISEKLLLYIFLL